MHFNGNPFCNIILYFWDSHWKLKYPDRSHTQIKIHNLILLYSLYWIRLELAFWDDMRIQSMGAFEDTVGMHFEWLLFKRLAWLDLCEEEHYGVVEYSVTVVIRLAQHQEWEGFWRLWKVVIYNKIVCPALVYIWLRHSSCQEYWLMCSPRIMLIRLFIQSLRWSVISPMWKITQSLKSIYRVRLDTVFLFITHPILWCNILIMFCHCHRETIVMIMLVELFRQILLQQLIRLVKSLER